MKFLQHENKDRRDGERPGGGRKLLIGKEWGSTDPPAPKQTHPVLIFVVFLALGGTVAGALPLSAALKPFPTSQFDLHHPRPLSASRSFLLQATNKTGTGELLAAPQTQLASIFTITSTPRLTASPLAYVQTGLYCSSADGERTSEHERWSFSDQQKPEQTAVREAGRSGSSFCERSIKRQTPRRSGRS